MASYKIKAEISYFQETQGVKALTEDIKHSSGLIIFVSIQDAPAARRIIAKAIKQGVNITLSPKQ
ncbi:MAG TPA: hypothetical protein VHI52_21880 [Verrucomicrobiae bacterium]|nr:hypothetical protein [Verrucomicrobiae bacterium]